MQIQRVQTGSVTPNAAGQAQRSARSQDTKAIDAPATDATDSLTIESKPADTTAPAARTPETTPTSAGKFHPRLQAFAERIEGRLAHAAEARDLSPRQQAALQQAQTQFHSLIQRLDDAYSSGADRRSPLMDSLHEMLDNLAHNVNHIQAGGGDVDVNA